MLEHTIHQNELFAGITRLKEKYVGKEEEQGKDPEKQLIQKPIFDLIFPLKSDYNGIFSLIIDIDQVRPLDLLGLASSMELILLIDEAMKKEREVFSQSLDGIPILQECYFYPQEKIGPNSGYKLKTDQEKSYFRECVIKEGKLLYEYAKKVVEIGDNIEGKIEAKLALYIANALKITEVSTLLTAKGITMGETFKESYRGFLRELKNSKYSISKALITCIKDNIKPIPIPNRLFKLSNQKDLYLALIEETKSRNFENLEIVKRFLVIFLANGIKPNIQDARGNTPLHWAVDKGYLEIVQELLANGADPTLKNNAEDTPLHLAAGSGHLKVVQELLAKDAKIDIRDINGSTPLHLAAGSGHLKVVQELLAKDAKIIDIIDKDGRTALHWAAVNGHLEVVQELLDKDAKIIDILDEDGRTALHWAAAGGHLEVVEALLAKDAKIIDIIDKNGSTALHWVAVNGNVKVVRALLAKDAKIDFQDVNGSTALHWAAGSGNVEVVQALLDNGATIDICDVNGSTALHWAAGSGNVEVVQELLAKNPKIINSIDKNGYTPLHWAAANGCLDIVKELLEKEVEKEGIKLDLQKKRKETPLHLAARYVHLAVVQALLAHKDTNPNTQDEHGNTPLHSLISNPYSSQDQKVEIVEALLTNNAKPDMKNKDEKTPRDLAAANGYLRIVEILDEKISTLTTKVKIIESFNTSGRH